MQKRIKQKICALWDFNIFIFNTKSLKKAAPIPKKPQSFQPWGENCVECFLRDPVLFTGNEVILHIPIKT
jgi:hypothetical protein